MTSERYVEALGALGPGGAASSLDVVSHERGVYALYVSSGGAAELTAAVGLIVDPGLLYVGRSAAQDLDVHILQANNVGQTTWRRTLASAYMSSRRLQMETVAVLAQPGKQRLENWLRGNVTVKVAPPLSSAEVTDLLMELDPPFNLNRAGPSPLRTRLTELRRALAQSLTEPVADQAK